MNSQAQYEIVFPTSCYCLLIKLTVLIAWIATYLLSVIMQFVNIELCMK
jgi:hypothetical protein